MLHKLVEGGGLDQHDAIVNVVGALLGVADDTGEADGLPSSLSDHDVVLTKPQHGWRGKKISDSSVS